MSRYNRGWAPYVPVAKRRKQAERIVNKLRRAGKTVTPVIIEGRQIATTFWGKAWCKNLEAYRDYAYRLERGRSCARHGQIVDLQMQQGKITALVNGANLYQVTITIIEISETDWKAICDDCSSGIDSLVDLLKGQFSKAVMERICRQDEGLFPKPTEICFACNCLDHASMCKHVAGTLYGVGARLDHEPELLFQLRGVNADDLIAQVDPTTPFSDMDPDKTLADNDLSALFGLDIAAEPAVVQKRPSLSSTSNAKTAAKTRTTSRPRNESGSPPPGRRQRKTRTRKTATGKTKANDRNL